MAIDRRASNTSLLRDGERRDRLMTFVDKKLKGRAKDDFSRPGYATVFSRRFLSHEHVQTYETTCIGIPLGFSP